MSIKCTICDGDSFVCGGCGALYESYELPDDPEHDARVRADERAKIAAALRTMTIRGSGGFLSATNLRERAARIAEGKV